MKTAFLSFIFVCALSLSAFSQSKIEYPQNQISMFYGGKMSTYGNAMRTTNLGNGDSKDDGKERMEYKSHSGVYSIEYLHYMCGPFELGAQLGFEQICSERWINRDGSPHTLFDSWDERNRTTYIMGVAQLNWVRSNWIGVYNKFGVGGRLIFLKRDYKKIERTDSDCEIEPCGDAIFGFEIGPTASRLFTEIGFGAQGFVAAGIRCRF